MPPNIAAQPPLSSEAGMLQELGEGEDEVFSKPPGTSYGYTEFTRAQLHIVAAAPGIPYPLMTGDYSSLPPT